MTIESGQKVLREVVLDQLTTGENHAYRMWLPRWPIHSGQRTDRA